MAVLLQKKFAPLLLHVRRWPAGFVRQQHFSPFPVRNISPRVGRAVQVRTSFECFGEHSRLDIFKVDPMPPQPLPARELLRGRLWTWVVAVAREDVELVFAYAMFKKPIDHCHEAASRQAGTFVDDREPTIPV